MSSNVPVFSRSEWDNKLISKKGKCPDSQEENIIKQFRRDDIFKSQKYTARFLFEKLCLKNSKNKRPSRPPNPFLITRAIFGMVAVENKIQIGDGTTTSILVSYVWGGADEQEKRRMKIISEEIKTIHKKKFPNYKYKPERSGIKDKFSNKTSKDFEVDFDKKKAKYDSQYQPEVNEDFGFEDRQMQAEVMQPNFLIPYYVPQYPLPFVDAVIYQFPQNEYNNDQHIIYGVPDFR
ncbi:hypothetical protein Glove_23g47 [Diversispora epigaea]|uniref:HMG box domain-containing protein n=1 Tax=Diversispora epigaea TaxID=1348612 RepID=A0A397JQS2_9GLOM|nr:hypothetical protein Glove_23g47 [Diversispora epigaea]